MQKILVRIAQLIIFMLPQFVSEFSLLSALGSFKGSAFFTYLIMWRMQGLENRTALFGLL